MSAEIRRMVMELLQAWNDHDIERVATFYAPEYRGIDVAQAEPQYGPEDRCKVLASYVRAFPDLRFTGETIVEGNRAALVWTMCGTHRGTIMRIPPTGRVVEVRGVSLLTVEDGKVKQGLNIWDMAGLLRAIGLLPDL